MLLLLVLENLGDYLEAQDEGFEVVFAFKACHDFSKLCEEVVD
jgi:hypothetical protein